MNATLKRLLNATWKVGVGLIGLAALAVGILVFTVWHEETRGRNYRYDKNLSKDIAVHSFNGNRERVWNRRTDDCHHFDKENTKRLCDALRVYSPKTLLKSIRRRFAARFPENSDSELLGFCHKKGINYESDFHY